jgi:hypothetical protein
LSHLRYLELGVIFKLRLSLSVCFPWRFSLADFGCFGGFLNRFFLSSPAVDFLAVSGLRAVSLNPPLL